MAKFPKTSRKLCQILSIEFPIIQAGMVWVSGWRLAVAAAESGCLGVIGAGSMSPEVLRLHCKKAKEITSKSIAINLPLLYSKVEEQIAIALDSGINIFITSAGSPKKYTKFLKDKGCVVIHVTSSPELAKKCEDAGCDAIVAEGFEAGGHNGRDEITTFCLVPQVVDAVQIPVIAAGGIADGRGIAAAFSLGASGVQIGTRFAATNESSAHPSFKQAIVSAEADATVLVMKELVPVRLIKNAFCKKILQAEAKCASRQELEAILGKGRAKLGMHEGDLEEGELEIGQIAALVKDIPKCSELVARLCSEYYKAQIIFE
ncbi:MAG: nitronate monooxygenase [Oligoflexales bacterium]|nr:nitronate monooxygenase [Oligoflexales bacterium]